MQAVTNKARGLKALLGVPLAGVLTNHSGFPLKAFGIRQRQAVLVEVAIIFGWIEFVVHLIYCINKNSVVKFFCINNKDMLA